MWDSWVSDPRPMKARPCGIAGFQTLSPWRPGQVTDWRLVCFFSGMHICSDVYSCVSERQKGCNGQNHCMDWTELLYGWNMSCKSARSHSLSEVDFLYNVRGWNVWFIILICPHQERWERDRMGCIWGIYEWNISFKYAHSQTISHTGYDTYTEYILLYVNVFRPSKKSGCIDLLISLRFPCVCMYVCAYACVSMQCGEYEGTQTIVRLICGNDESSSFFARYSEQCEMVTTRLAMLQKKLSKVTGLDSLGELSWKVRSLGLTV